MAIVPGEGTELKLSISSTLTTIAQLVSIDPAEKTRPAIDTSDLASTARTFRAGMLDNGELSGVLHYDPGVVTHAALTTSIDAGTLETWELIFNDAGDAKYGFSAFLTKFKPTGTEIDGNLGAEFAIKISGAVVITP